MICFLVPLVASIKLHCSYSQPGLGSKVKQPYTCRLRDFRIESPTETVDEVTGTHHGNKTQADVTSVKFVNSPKMLYFPKGIENVFVDITHITVSESGLSEIHQSDLKPFPKLQYLTLYKTKITTLESGLFQFNPRLNKLYVTDDNACISLRATNQDEVKLVEEEIVTNCQHPA